jgi:predicted enzyme related to lactoylglutathione lyase
MTPDVEAAPIFAPLLLARDFPATLAFYEVLLNIPTDGESPYARLVTEHSRISMADAKWWAQVSGIDAALRGDSGLPNFVVVIQVANVEQEFERLAARGVRFLSPPTFRSKMGLQNAILRDPDGRSVMLSSPVN